MRTVLMFVICLSANLSATAAETTMSAQQLAETQLLAEYVGLPEEQFKLGRVYDRGDGLPKDDVQAVEWYRKAGEQGYVPAQFELGNKYARGEGAPQNYAEAYVWFNLAAAAGHEAARKERDKYARRLTNEELIAAQQRATQIFENSKRYQPGG